jgi:hypothetical protein
MIKSGELTVPVALHPAKDDDVVLRLHVPEPQGVVLPQSGLCHAHTGEPIENGTYRKSLFQLTFGARFNLW